MKIISETEFIDQLDILDDDQIEELQERRKMVLANDIIRILNKIDSTLYVIVAEANAQFLFIQSYGSRYSYFPVKVRDHEVPGVDGRQYMEYLPDYRILRTAEIYMPHEWYIIDDLDRPWRSIFDTYHGIFYSIQELKNIRRAAWDMLVVLTHLGRKVFDATSDPTVVAELSDLTKAMTLYGQLLEDTIAEEYQKDELIIKDYEVQRDRVNDIVEKMITSDDFPWSKIDGEVPSRLPSDL